MSIILIVAGCVEKDFYWAKGAVLSDRKMPLWAGRLLFIGIGFSMFVFFCINLYYRND